MVQLTRSFILFILIISGALSASPANKEPTFDMDHWLKMKFAAQHEKLIPIVAVADMVFACEKSQQERGDIAKSEAILTVKQLLTEVEKDVLAEKLITCLDGATVKSDKALNFGLYGCFYEQFSLLSLEEKQAKMQIVKQAMLGLSRAERQKSFTQCTVDQAIGYLQ